MKATGSSQFGITILWVITGTLILANAFNVYQLIALKDKSTLLLILDSFWPISNLKILVVGITVVKTKVLFGWQRFVPLVTGLWFPLTALGMILAGRDTQLIILVPYYSAIAWSLLAVVFITHKEKSLPEKVATTFYQIALTAFKLCFPCY